MIRASRSTADSAPASGVAVERGQPLTEASGQAPPRDGGSLPLRESAVPLPAIGTRPAPDGAATAVSPVANQKVVRLADLPEPARRLILALIAADKAAKSS